MLSFIVVEDDVVTNLILAESKDIAEELSGATCIEYDPTKVNPKIGQSVENDQVVDLEVYPEIVILDESELDEEVVATDTVVEQPVTQPGEGV